MSQLPPHFHSQPGPPPKSTGLAGSQRLLIVVIDDNRAGVELMETALQTKDLAIHGFSDPEEGLDFILDQHPQLVITDLVMPTMSGMELLERVVAFDPEIDVILTTAHYSTESAVEAIRKGASDYLDKPVSVTVLRERVGKLLERHRLRLRANELEKDLVASAVFEGMVGNSPQMWQLFSQIQRVAPHYRSALVHGATGTGKELVAQALHRLSPVSKGKLVALNCSAVVETLFESELFGHVKGAFTGASQDKVGLFEHAHDGTLFLDEIGDMPLSTQAKLLRSLQNQEVQKLGSLTPRRVNVRVVAATNRDLRVLIAEKRFREDLFYRLSMIELEVPRLIDRDGDVNLLTRHFVAKSSALYGKPLTGVSNRAQLVLRNHTWPGNVRELENVMGHAAIMTNGAVIDVQDLPGYLRHGGAPGLAVESSAGISAGGGLSFEEQEKRVLLEALEKSGGNQSQTARLLQISRDKLRYRMKRHGLG